MTSGGIVQPGQNLSQRPINGQYGWGPAAGSAANPRGDLRGYTYNIR
ncbi:hypothetical protein DDB_G0269070 [Dictyostelium discoideum AX4]|uniref:Uncharacterized protein n=1 Tax=Dictyostelium discoideum TaxID=44689 RepID=Q54ZF4_DICDI|nr:hypothetical protein DDB_G0294605 [Dictyostelium discoideum AX4]XP_642543.1 hypothetical protein DDB_G0277595 [Dictyostelium discoideum AX4]XP_644167.1 hypothetical protein DDB_G0274459 [Dictyostelium discoideum AX4]XP_646913.1 hypothetical protein DDB_G0269070 [Dictyostelium discoideum AX4]EAL68615.1 hypothetical protein DDB_G0277595 [Dictyostelium discoideum AX4]EAL70122.1 hypothetical protein DDB_G0274459 [Dictyostelium discoideum AX4]EAL73124.1 hypothetical protein DDB_G0269070 [Dictyo|eukprot:XP_001732998.1 hypothetical protein DDB_G0294605 [Dictyostelium discoideum AX4]